jgi:conjugal transfer/entry exclusion protein
MKLIIDIYKDSCYTICIELIICRRVEMRKTDFSKYTKEELVEIATKQAEQVENLKKQVQADEKRIEKLEKIIDKLEKDKKEWFEIDKNASAYATAKQFEDIKRVAREYEDLYKNALEREKETMERFRKRLENTKEIVHNERGAGRKLKADEEAVKKIISDNKEKSLREIEKLLADEGEKISIMTIRKIKNELCI